ncbi:uncharacterized protein LOC111106315 isoform X1 [Crassostrea virginica]
MRQHFIHVHLLGNKSRDLFASSTDDDVWKFYRDQMNFTTSGPEIEIVSDQATTPHLFYNSFSLPKKNEIDVVGLGVGVFFCVLGVTLVIYCITRASGCYGNGRHAPTEIKITYFDDDAVTGVTSPMHRQEETDTLDSGRPVLDTLKIPREHSLSLPPDMFSDVKTGSDCMPNQPTKQFESDTIVGLKRMGIL